MPAFLVTGFVIDFIDLANGYIGSSPEFIAADFRIYAEPTFVEIIDHELALGEFSIEVIALGSEFELVISGSGLETHAGHVVAIWNRIARRGNFL